MARTENEKTRDEQLINLLVGILNELKSLRVQCEEHWKKGDKK